MSGGDSRYLRRDAPLDDGDVEQAQEPPDPQHRRDARRLVGQHAVKHSVTPPVDDAEIFIVRLYVVSADVMLRGQQ